MGMSSSKTCACHNVGRCRAGEAGRLFLWFPVPHTLTKVVPFLKQASFEFELMQERPGLSMACKAGQAQEVARHLAKIVAPRELKETQVLFVHGAVQPQLQDFSDISSLQRFIKISQSDWLVDMLASDRVTSHFQPIVSIDDTTQIYGYESLFRGLDEHGNLVMPASIFDLATEAGLLPQLDRVARLSAIEQASQHNLTGRLFINFSPTALYDPVSCLRSTVDAIDRAGIGHEQVVFEVVESDNPQDLDHLKTVLKYYREAGFAVALDDLGSGYSGLNLLHQLRPDFVKLDMELIRNVHLDPYKASITEKLLEIAQNLNIKTVAEGIECIEELNWLQERGATFAQGYLIAKPAAVPIKTTPYFSSAVTLTPAPLQPVMQTVQNQTAPERIVAAVTQHIRQSLELDEILQTTADEVRQLFEVDRVVIYQFEPDWRGLVAVESLAEGCPSILGFHVMDTCFQTTHAAYYQQGNTRAIEDIETAGLMSCHIELLQSLNIRANLIVPILQKERLWGLLIAHQCSETRQWQQAEVNLLYQLAGQAAIAIQQAELYQQLQTANQELQRLASVDGLTQLANRRCFDDRLSAEWQRLAREQAPLSLILCDVDCFKLYNDTHGHLAGDDALRQVANAIVQASRRPSDLAARYGGEEFAIILPNTTAKGALAVVKAIQANLAALQLPHPQSPVGDLMTLSFGVATVVPQSNLSFATLIATADQGLYRAKAQGKNCAV
ncbi:EAL domain-containing protein [Leptolyngbya sp. FACHB-60]|uniref:EAL domain-containing protein n=2 Tax=Cyanophyceae TaxID=3028117 RepID=UPI001686E38C|nr:EAL domain-containing protein [Phormidium sp. FACHB-77]MBD2029336.1 EAL domain-containing protein [Phormidium sp. FACHB-322]MBD2053195.1 EAL domain-containing protein [Leptolyngbya sp. FACHB-60]